ncbi:hypothetical protein BV25DRAFT_1832359 [Artomyces pyxidatus]|uniref:Uncharacterized protein n=1 Tax=Artomyces pyxidatus TaxID=48021 RepID=A0ACB8SIF9_9AGAM|nr:hypothetical protein BV25DRAFT_1832359 [Artomyces pyxidatus]
MSVLPPFARGLLRGSLPCALSACTAASTSRAKHSAFRCSSGPAGFAQPAVRFAAVAAPRNAINARFAVAMLHSSLYKC